MVKLFQMRRFSKLIVLFLFVFRVDAARSQSTELGGYTKLLATHNILSKDIPEFLLNLSGFDYTYTDYQIHNRINFNARPSENITFKLGLRNRVFWGYQSGNNPQFRSQLEQDPAGIDLSTIWLKSGSITAHSIIDRLSIQWSNNQWEIKLGRQRMNWAMHTIWNPNDLFNTYNYLDFDYEERPGSDALQATRYIGSLSELSMAIAALDNREMAVASKYKTHLGNYDVQIIGGYWRRQWVMGNGFAGDLGSGSLKGEWTAFFPASQSLESDRPPALSASLGYEFTLPGGWFLSANALYNSEGSKNGDFITLLQQNNSSIAANNARLLFPFKTTFFIGAGGTLTSLLRFDAGILSDSRFNQLIAVQTLSYSAGQNLDISLVSQIFLGDLDLTILQTYLPSFPLPPPHFGWLNGSFFGRIKHSF